MINPKEYIKERFTESQDMDFQSISSVSMAELIINECDSIAELLIEKNRKYGNSVFEGIDVFYKGDPLEGINVRLDDKLKRIRNRVDDDEDTELDLIGYLILKRILLKLRKEYGKAKN